MGGLWTSLAGVWLAQVRVESISRDEVALFASAARVTQIRENEAFGTRGSALERPVQLFGSPRTIRSKKAPISYVQFGRARSAAIALTA